MWLGSDSGSVCQVQLTTPRHTPHATPIITTVISLGPHGSHTPSQALKLAAWQLDASSLKALPCTAQSPPASSRVPGTGQSRASLVPSTTGSIKPAGEQHTITSRQQPPAAEISSSVADLRPVSPFSRVPENLDAHALHQPKTNVAALSTSASSCSPASSLLIKALDRHRLPEQGACQLAHDGPVQHILIAKDRVVTCGGAKCILREWSFLGKLDATHRTCAKGTAAASSGVAQSKSAAWHHMHCMLPSACTILCPAVVTTALIASKVALMCLQDQ